MSTPLFEHFSRFDENYKRKRIKKIARTLQMYKIINTQIERERERKKK